MTLKCRADNFHITAVCFVAERNGLRGKKGFELFQFASKTGLSEEQWGTREELASQWQRTESSLGLFWLFKTSRGPATGKTDVWNYLIKKRKRLTVANLILYLTQTRHINACTVLLSKRYFPIFCHFTFTFVINVTALGLPHCFHRLFLLRLCYFSIPGAVVQCIWAAPAKVSSSQLSEVIAFIRARTPQWERFLPLDFLIPGTPDCYPSIGSDESSQYKDNYACRSAKCHEQSRGDHCFCCDEAKHCV